MLVKRFEEVVSAYENRTAICTAEGALTYGELNREVDRAAGRIAAGYGSAAETAGQHVVALLFDHGVDAVAAVLAALKAGKIYVPFDSTYPQKRLEYMLKHSGARMIVTNSRNLELANRLSAAAAEKIVILDINDITIETPPGTVNKKNPHAYLLYTSGSTGSPKAVLQAHHSVAHFIDRYRETLAVTPGDRMTLFSSFSHDAAVMDIYGALLNGAALYPMDARNQDGLWSLAQWLNRERITVWHSVPTFFRYFMDALESKENISFPYLRCIVLGGEAVLLNDIRRFQKLFTNTLLYNLYGQTESTYNGGAFFSPGADVRKVVLGEAVAGTELLVLDDRGTMVEELETGEIFVASPHVACGYWNEPEATAKVFLYGQSPGRVYRTGDLARIDYDDSMEFMGRKDHQIKIRGYRIEPGEIESRLLNRAEIKEAVVTAVEDESGDKFLCAYIVPHSHPFNIPPLRDALAQELPDYMVPAYFTRLEALPLTPGGKIDRKALPKPQKGGSEQERITPRDDLEKKLAGLWAKVLGVDPEIIGIDTNFIELGGHSLKAVVLAAEIHREWGVKVPLPRVFQTPTIRGLAEYIEYIKVSAKNKHSPFKSIEPAEKKEYYVLSPAQRRLYILWQMETGSVFYNMPLKVRLEGNIEIGDLENTFHRLIKRHASLRTSFEIIGENPVQKVHENVAFEIEYVELPLISQFIRPFDLSQAPLLRVGLIQVQEKEYILMVDMHHMITDGVSRTLLIRDFMQLLAGNEPGKLRLQYRDYAEWLNYKKEQEVLKKQETFWLNQFEGDIPLLHLPTDHSRPAVQSFEGNTIAFEPGPEQTGALKGFAVQEDVTLFMVLLALINVLLSRLSSQEDIVVGSPLAGRGHADLQQMVGMFVNTIVLRNRPEGEKTLRQFLQEIKTRTLAAFDNQDYPFEDLVDKVVKHRDVSRNPLFDVMFALQNMDTAPIDAEAAGLRITPLENPNKTAKFDLSFTAAEVNSNLLFTLEYGTKLFEKETLQRWIGYFKRIVSSVLRRPDTRLRAVDILSEEEKQEILIDFNNTAADYPKERTIHGLFEEQTAGTPDHIAVVSEGSQLAHRTYLTYDQLNKKSNQLARLLRKKGVIPDSITAVIAAPSIDMVVAMMAVLKAGGAYLPLDAKYPQERNKFMLEDIGVEMLLIQADLIDKIKNICHPIAGENIIILDDRNLYTGESVNLNINNNPGNLAYAMYTSGSTGKPKGVAVEHRDAVNVLCWFGKTFHPGTGTHVLQLTDFTFDPSVEDIFGSLLHGAALYVVDIGLVSDTYDFCQFVNKHQVQIINFVPTMLEPLLVHEQKLESLRFVISGGEKLEDSVKDRIIEKGYRLYNNYGPVETTVDALAGQCSADKVSLGKPIANVRCYILDKYNNPAPVGITGELCIAGAGVTRGYLNNPELTNSKFQIPNYKQIPNSKFQMTNIPHSPIYKTGDLARWLPGGTVEFLGRMDHQVKIRGYRIELGEIKNRLLKYQNLREAVVLVREDETGDNYICAYFTAGQALSTERIKQYLSKYLPGYMIPSYFMQMEKIPLTPNGKIDREALPLPGVQVEGRYKAPGDEVETKLVELWSEVLGIEKQLIGIENNFFQLGGHSLKAAVLTTKIHKALQVKVSLMEMFKLPTIKGLAGYIKRAVKHRYVSIEPVEEKEYYALSSMQRRLYVLQQLEPGSTAYNLPLAVNLENEPNREKMHQAFARLIRRHESLRTSFPLIDGEPVQVVHHHVEFKIQYVDLPLISQFTRPFDLSRAPLMRAGLMKTGKGKHLFLMDMHHIITDGISMEIFIKELMALYRGEELPETGPPTRYRDFAAWQNRMLASGLMKTQEDYWKNEFNSDIPVLNLPLDYPRPATWSFEGNSLLFELDREENRLLQARALDEGTTLFMLLLGVLNVFFSKLSGQEDIVIGTPVAGRRHTDLEQVIGLFINTLALRNFPRGEKQFNAFLGEIKEKTLKSFENQEYQFEDLVEGAAVNRDTGRNPLFDVMFTFQESEADPGNIPEKGMEKKTAKFDMNVTAWEANHRLIINLEYCTKLFKEETIKRFIGYFRRVVSSVLRQPDTRLFDIDILSEEEKRKILVDFNNTAAHYPKDRTIHQLFEEQAAGTPDNIAVVPAGPRRPHRTYKTHLTYKKLNKSANQMAVVLREKGVIPGCTAGLMVERSPGMVIAVMAILKAGGAYLPIDPTYPEKRIGYILKDSGAVVLLKSDVLNFEHLNFDIVSNFDIRASNLAPSDLCYVIYTSGSTGKPKGVMVEHRAVVNYIWWAVGNYVRGEKIDFPLYTSISFDLTVTSLFTPLITGNAVVVYEEDEEEKEFLIERVIEEDRVGAVKLTPSHLKLLREKAIKRKPVNLKRFIVGGENLDRQLALDIHNAFGGKVEIYNEYGPTEAAVGCMIYKFDPVLENGSAVPIGVPGANAHIYLLDRNRKPVPTGVATELYIAGDGIARGYLNNPELTVEKFDHDLWDLQDYHDEEKKVTIKKYNKKLLRGVQGGGFLEKSPPGRRRQTIYKTGDLAKRLPDGNLEFLGRIDHQVKIRGFRIELGEIEGHLSNHPGIKEAVVLQKRNGAGDNYLCAYIVPDGHKAQDAGPVREYLAKTLPLYMIPGHFVTLEQIPLTTSGKVDRQALLRYKESRLKTHAAYTPPQTALEKTIAETWQQVLQVDQVGAHDNFFDLGGNSFDIIKINSKLKEILKKDFPVVKMFKYPTIRSLAGYLDHGETGKVPESKEIKMTENMNKGKNRLKERTRRKKMKN